MISLSTLVTIARSIPKVLEVLKLSEPVLSAVEKVAPHVLPIIEDLANQYTKGDKEKLATVIYAPHRMTKEEETEWFNSQNDKG